MARGNPEINRRLWTSPRANINETQSETIITEITEQGGQEDYRARIEDGSSI